MTTEIAHYTLTTDRLILRQWLKSDIAAFTKMSADPRVMRYFPSILSETQSTHIAKSLQQDIAQTGWGMWALSLKETDEFIGFTGLRPQDGDIPLSPFLEIAWRLDAHFWHKGYASEAATAALAFAFDKLKAPTVYAFTTRTNVPSITLMKRMGMKNMEQDFNHPLLDEHHPLVEHVLYGIQYDAWASLMRENPIITTSL